MAVMYKLPGAVKMYLTFYGMWDHETLPFGTAHDPHTAISLIELIKLKDCKLVGISGEYDGKELSGSCSFHDADSLILGDENESATIAVRLSAHKIALSS